MALALLSLGLFDRERAKKDKMKNLPLLSTWALAGLLSAGMTACAEDATTAPDVSEDLRRGRCGDGVCAARETCSSCVQDCGQCGGTASSDGGVVSSDGGGAVSSDGGGAVNCVSAPTSSLVVNVKDTGAKGDGVTNDTVAIQNAVNQVTGTGGTVYVPDGTYMIDAVVKLFVKSNMTFKMSDGAVLRAIPNNNTNYDIIRINYASNVNVIGGTLQGERYQHTGTSGEWGMGLSIYGSDHVVIQGVTARDTWGDGFYLGSSNPTDITFCSVTADNNRRQGLSIITANGVVIRDSTFKNTKGTAPAAGIDIEPDANNTVNNVQILNSQFIDNDQSGVLVTLNPAYNGISFITNITISGNTMSGNDQHFYNVNPEGGIVLLNVSQVMVSNNTITGDIKDGIQLSTSAKANTVSGNVVMNNQRYGIHMTDGATNNTIKNNTVSGNLQQIVDEVGGNVVSP